MVPFSHRSTGRRYSSITEIFHVKRTPCLASVWFGRKRRASCFLEVIDVFSVAVVETDDLLEKLFFWSHLRLITCDHQLSTASVMVSKCVRDLVDVAELELAEDTRDEENADNFHFMI